MNYIFWTSFYSFNDSNLYPLMKVKIGFLDFFNIRKTTNSKYKIQGKMVTDTTNYKWKSVLFCNKKFETRHLAWFLPLIGFITITFRLVWCKDLVDYVTNCCFGNFSFNEKIVLWKIKGAINFTAMHKMFYSLLSLSHFISFNVSSIS